MQINNVEQLQSYLAEQVTSISEEGITPAVANAQANMAGKIISTLKYQIEYNKMRGKNDKIKFLEV